MNTGCQSTKMTKNLPPLRSKCLSTSLQPWRDRSLTESVLNNKAGYKRSGVTRFTLSEEDTAKTPAEEAWKGSESAPSMENEGKLDMARKALEVKEEENAKNTKRNREDEEITQQRKRN